MAPVPAREDRRIILHFVSATQRRKNSATKKERQPKKPEGKKKKKIKGKARDSTNLSGLVPTGL